jgi:release factor glutamine methyltransferase
VKPSRQRAVANRLGAVAGDAAMIEARWLLEEAGTDDAKLEAFIARRLAGEPVDRIIGHRGFWTLDIKVTSATLSPRSDTETVVRAGRDLMLAHHGKHSALRILDLGTGTGAILLALLDEFPGANGLGIDISEQALLVARENAGHIGLSDRATFQQGDWTADLTGPFDLIVSNPPYIPTPEIAGLDPEVRDHDPHLALDGGADGLACYRALLPQIPPLLAPCGVAVLEFGQGQGAAVLGIARACGLALVEFRNDLNEIERAIILNKIGNSFSI